MTDQKLRRRVWRDGNSVVLRDDDPWDGERLRWFWVPPDGGYVREISESRPGTLGRQVCDGLSDRGWALRATPETLPDVIRREYRAAERQARRERERWS